LKPADLAAALFKHEARRIAANVRSFPGCYGKRNASWI
jgi:hypothetical protein